MTIWTVQDRITDAMLDWDSQGSGDLDMSEADREMGRYVDTGHLEILLALGPEDDAQDEADYLGLAICRREYSVLWGQYSDEAGRAVPCARLTQWAPAEQRWVEPLDPRVADALVLDTVEGMPREHVEARLIETAGVDPEEVTGSAVSI